MTGYQISTKLKHIPFCLIILLFACSNEHGENTKIPDNPVDSFESAIPHGQALPETDLSDEDRLKLARASGRETMYISTDSLSSLINLDSMGLVIFNFWNLDCLACQENMKVLKQLKYSEAIDFELIHINTDTLYPEMINSFIRENQLISPVFTLQKSDTLDWQSMIYHSWDGQLPAVLVNNTEDATQLFYQKEFEVDEIRAVLLPLTY